MNDEVLETAESDTEFVEYDYSTSSGSNEGNHEINIYYPASINLYSDSLEESSSEESESKSTEAEIYLEDVEISDPVRVLSVASNSSNSKATLSSEAVKNLWSLSIGGREYKVLFPIGAELDIIDDTLINRSASNITGVIIDSSLSDSSYFNYTFTILPFTSSSSQNTVYRYGARSYLTRYYTGTSQTTLVTDVSYYNATVIDRPVGASFNRFQITTTILLVAGIVVSIIGGLIRR